MAKEKTKEPKIILEREYIVPLRRGWLKVPKYKRATKAVKTLKEFIVKHMKLYTDDLRFVKVDIDLNNEIRFRGMKKPPAKIKVKAIKYDNGIVKVDLVDIPENVKYKRLREEKKKSLKKPEEKKVEDKEKKEEKPEKNQEGVEVQEKEIAAKEESLKIAKEQAKGLKHISKDKKTVYHRTALKK